jgi:NADPH:quinone reductase-like Zn-dependent oxidoreductase
MTEQIKRGTGTTMKAVLLHGYGGVEQLQYEDAPEPNLASDGVIVRVISTSINPVDYKLRSGAMKGAVHLNFPTVLGRDVAGEVTGLGAGVRKFKVGDKVMGLVRNSYAEYLSAQADALTSIPDGLDPLDAGVLPLVALTGAQLIETGVQPSSGELVLVTGAAGSVGRTAVFVARQHGAKVIAGVRAAQKGDAQSLGADSVVALDDDKETDALPELDAIADTIDGETLSKLLPKLKKSGRLASVLGQPEAAKKAGVNVNAVFAQPDPNRLYKLAEDVRDGRLKNSNCEANAAKRNS